MYVYMYKHYNLNIFETYLNDNKHIYKYYIYLHFILIYNLTGDEFNTIHIKNNESIIFNILYKINCGSKKITLTTYFYISNF